MTSLPSQPSPDLVLDLGNSRLHAAFFAGGKLLERFDRPLGPPARGATRFCRFED